jgi:di/tricarboxylate transporter
MTFVWGISLMLFLATPPNAMILSNNNVKISDLIKAGIGLKLFGIVVIFVESIVLLTSIFHIDEMGTILNTTEIASTMAN